MVGSHILSSYIAICSGDIPPVKSLSNFILNEAAVIHILQSPHNIYELRIWLLTICANLLWELILCEKCDLHFVQRNMYFVLVMVHFQSLVGVFETGWVEGLKNVDLLDFIEQHPIQTNSPSSGNYWPFREGNKQTKQTNNWSNKQKKDKSQSADNSASP